MEAKIIVVVDNDKILDNLSTGWGLSVYIEVSGEEILFDTGPDDKLLEKNLEALKIKPENIDKIVISHPHGDHTGGLPLFQRLGMNTNVFVSSHSGLEKFLKRMGLNPVKISKTTEIVRDVYIVGELSSGRWGLWEQALAIKTEGKLNILAGCSHPGIDNIVGKALDEIGGELGIVMGGFHNPSKETLDRLVGLKPKKIFPMHCSGSLAKEYLKLKYPKIYAKGGAGLEIEL